MTHKRIKAYWLLLLVFLYTAGIVLSVGDAQARCANTVDWNTLVEARNDAISSNCLADTDEAPLTVLVGEIPLETSSEVDFWLQANDMDASGILAWTVDQPDYLTVTMISGEETIERDTEVELLADDIPLDVSMCLEPTELARTEVREALDVNVTVTWGDRMSGTFQITLPEVTDEADTDEEEESSEEERDDSNSASDEEEDSNTDATVPEGESDETENAAVTENTETVELAKQVYEADVLEPQSDSDATESTTEPVTEGTVAEKSATQATESTETEMSTVPTTESVGTEPSAVSATEATEAEVSVASSAEPAETDPSTTPTTEPEETDPTTTPTTEPAETDPSTAPTTEPAETDPSTTPTTEPEETDPTTTPTTEPEETDPSTAPTTEPVETEPATEPTTEPVETEPVTEPTDAPEDGDVEKPIEQDNQEIQLGTISGFDVSGLLPVKISLTEDATSICLGLWKADEENNVLFMQPFPDYTRISLDGGESYYVMYNDCMAEFALSESKTLSVLLDFSNAELYAIEELMLAMKVYAQDTLLATRAVTTVPNGLQISYAADTLNSGRVTEDTGTEETEKETTAPEVYILTQKESLDFILPESWAEYTLEYSVEQLTMTEENTLEYIQVDLTAEALIAEYINDEQGHFLSLSVGEVLPRAGTYRINLKWSYEGICYAQTQTTFFINYTAYSQLLGS